MNLILELVGITLIVAALVVLAIVAGSFRWEYGALVGAVEAAVLGGVLVAVANRPSARRPAP